MPETYRILDRLGNDLLLGLPLFSLHGVDGLGMPDVAHQTEQYAQQDGEVYVGSTLRKRVITITFDMIAETEADMWTDRLALVEFLKDLAQGFRLECTTPAGDIFFLALRYAGMYSAPRTRDMHDRQQRAVIQAVALDPLWYNPVQELWAFAVGGGPGTWGWESDGLGFPAGWGASVAPGTPESKTYSGSWRDFPIIELQGPMEDIQVINYTTGDVLEFVPGYTLDDGDTITIDLRQGVKTVTHSVDGNIVDALTDDSDLGAWHIAAHPEAPAGINSIAVAFTGGNENSRVYIRYYERFVAI